MYKNHEFEEICYRPDHFQVVKQAIEASFPRYFDQFIETRAGTIVTDQRLRELAEHFGSNSTGRPRRVDGKMALRAITEAAIDGYEKQRDKYLNLMNLDFLTEYQADPPGFKTTALKKECPIIRGTLHSTKAKELDKYRKSFGLANPTVLLDAVTKMAEFIQDYSARFSDQMHEAAADPAGFQLMELDKEEYWVPGVIGGGIRSHLLFKFNAQLFANRSQDAVWALWYLTGKQAFGCRYDSEFLMIGTDKNTFDQNYFYPYDLFLLYARAIWRLLDREARVLDVSLSSNFRYVYVDAFFAFVAKTHASEIGELKRDQANEHFAS